MCVRATALLLICDRFCGKGCHKYCNPCTCLCDVVCVCVYIYIYIHIYIYVCVCESPAADVRSIPWHRLSHIPQIVHVYVYESVEVCVRESTTADL